jgi:hypothetical protein
MTFYFNRKLRSFSHFVSLLQNIGKILTKFGIITSYKKKPQNCENGAKFVY